MHRHRGHAVLAQLDRGRQREPVVRRLGHRVGRAEGVLLGLRHRHRDRHHQAVRGRDEQRGAHRGRHVVGPHPAAEHRVEQLDRLLPERRGPLLPAAGVEPLVAAPRIVDQQVEPSVVRPDPPGHRPDGLVVPMVAGHRHAEPAGRGHRLRGLLHRAREVPGPPGRRGPRGHVHHPAGLPQGRRHPAPHPAAAPGHPGNAPSRFSPCHAAHPNPRRTGSPRPRRLLDELVVQACFAAARTGQGG